MIRRYFLKRVAIAFPTLLGISLVYFLLVQLTPGGPVEETLAEWQHSGLAGESSGARVAQVTDEQREALIAYYGFDKPIFLRYVLWMKKLLQGDLGESYFYSEPVSKVLLRALPVSLSLGLLGFFVSYVVCIPLGIYKAVRQGSFFDSATSVLVFFLYSMPPFAFGILLIVLFGGGSFWKVFPIEGLVSDHFNDLSAWEKICDFILHISLPLTCYTIGSFASLTLLMKNSLIDELSKDYILTARAKGLSEKRVVLHHALRNALLPIANGIGQWLAVFFSGSLLIETIFGLQGLGRLSYESILHRDYPVVLADLMLLSVAQILGNLFSDFLYVVIDPRIDYE